MPVFCWYRQWDSNPHGMSPGTVLADTFFLRKNGTAPGIPGTAPISPYNCDNSRSRFSGGIPMVSMACEAEHFIVFIM